jgi:hypothetical protein
MPKKARKLSDGRYPWEPKASTIERRRDSLGFGGSKSEDGFLILLDKLPSENDLLSISLPEAGLTLKAPAIFKRISSGVKRIADRLGIPPSKQKKMHYFPFLLEPASGGQTVGGLCFTRYDFTQCTLLDVDARDQSDIPESIVKIIQSGEILPHMITMARGLASAGMIKP